MHTMIQAPLPSAICRVDGWIILLEHPEMSTNCLKKMQRYIQVDLGMHSFHQKKMQRWLYHEIEMQLKPWVNFHSATVFKMFQVPWADRANNTANHQDHPNRVFFLFFFSSRKYYFP